MILHRQPRVALGARNFFLLLSLVIASFAVRAAAGGFDQAIDRLQPRVVKLYGLGAGVQAGYGSGVVVSEDGLILTVSSLLIDAKVISVVTPEGVHYTAEIVRRDEKLQLALLRMTKQKSDQNETWPADSPSFDPVAGLFPFFDLACESVASSAQSSSLQPGDWIIAAGNAFKVADGPEPVSIAHGVFSARTRLDARRRVNDFPYTGEVLIIDGITSNPGAPGSAVVNIKGEFVGMIGRLVISNQTHTHLNYAIPRSVLCNFFLQAQGEDGTNDSTRSRESHEDRIDLGIKISKTGYRTVLPYVERVKRKSLADLAGVRKDDLILSINGRNVPDVAAYKAGLNRLDPGEPIEIVIRRGRVIKTIFIETKGP